MTNKMDCEKDAAVRTALQDIEDVIFKNTGVELGLDFLYTSNSRVINIALAEVDNCGDDPRRSIIEQLTELHTFLGEALKYLK